MAEPAHCLRCRGPLDDHQRCPECEAGKASEELGLEARLRRLREEVRRERGDAPPAEPRSPLWRKKKKLLESDPSGRGGPDERADPGSTEDDPDGAEREGREREEGDPDAPDPSAADPDGTQSTEPPRDRVYRAGPSASGIRARELDVTDPRHGGDAVRELLEHRRKGLGKIIGIAGLPRHGKTKLADRLRERYAQRPGADLRYDKTERGEVNLYYIPGEREHHVLVDVAGEDFQALGDYERELPALVRRFLWPVLQKLDGLILMMALPVVWAGWNPPPGSGEDRRATLVAILSVAGGAAGVGWLWWWATRSVSPSRTLALGARVQGAGFVLDSALEVTWRRSVVGDAELGDRWLSLVAPDLPPGLCPILAADGTPGTRPAGDALASALATLDRVVGRGGDPEAVGEAIDDVLDVAGGEAGGRRAFLVRYGLGRAYGAAGDWAAAAEVLAPVFERHLSLERVPEAGPESAVRRVAEGLVNRELAVDAFHGRYLAGTVAYHRGEPRRAVTHFRRAINAVYYLLAVDGPRELSSAGHDRRVVVPPGRAACGGGVAPLSSLDAYAGLVASYMADEDFHDPGGLPGEVARSRFEVDPDDPFGPVLEHARRTGGDPTRTPIPENLLWAASNLQRVYHQNRLRPDPRLDVTRAVLLLHLTDDPARVAALEERGGAEPCRMLGTLADELRSDAGRPGPDRRADPLASDSARAAVAVRTFARLERGCPETSVPAVESEVKSAWIRLAGGYLGWGVGSLYESVRVALASELSESARPVGVIEEAVEPHLATVLGHLDVLERGRVPADLPAGLPVESVLEYGRRWWSAVFVDVAESLAERGRESGGLDAIRSGEVPAYLTALESAVDHAGLGPADVYSASELESLANAAGGRSAGLKWRVRTWARDHEILSAAILGGVALLTGLAILVGHVTWWRYHLLTRQRFYVEELARRERRVAT